MNKFKNLALVLALSTVALTACGNEGATTDTADNTAETTAEAPIEDTASVEEATTAEETTDEATTDEAVEEDAATEEEVVEGEETEEEAADAEMTDEEVAEEEVAEDETTTSDADPLELVSEENPIYVDKENQTVTIYTTYNGKYETEPTRHLAIHHDGKFADKSIFDSYATPEQFHQALLDIGAEPGDNMTKENAEETTSEGSPLGLTFYWAGNEAGTDINDIVVDSNGTPIDLRFTGNLTNAEDKHTGCVSCLDSCIIGISSNAAYPYGSVEKTKIVEFTANADLAPEDGTPVVIVYSLK